MPKRKRAKTKKEKELKVCKGQYFAVGDNKAQIERLTDKVSNKEKNLLLLDPKQSSGQALRRATKPRGHRPVRITPRTPRLRR